MVSKPVWFCREFGVDGHIVIAVDQAVAEGQAGYRRYLHPIQLDQAADPRGMFCEIIREMSDVIGRMSAPTQPVSRACAFSHHQEQ
ncbi:hypothetical protein [Pseudomonas asiatica]|uniref:hypothetical protein n=1 Tax=Pseudomonas asiatica TaxID=2219225 RepID=UPI003B93FC8F